MDGSPAISRPSELRYLLTVTTIAAVYFSGAVLGLSLASLARQVSPVWPPTGIALAALLLFGYRVWPGVAAGALLINAISDEPFPVACGIAVGNTLEALLGAFLLRRVVGFQPGLERLRDVLGLTICSAVISTIVSASIGVSSLCLGGVQAWSQSGRLWLTWWLGDAMGALIVAPALLTWCNVSASGLRTRIGESAALFAALIAVGQWIFASLFTRAAQFKYLVLPLFIWAALRLSQLIVTAATIVVATLAIWCATRDAETLTGAVVNQRLLLMQTFMGVVSVGSLALGAVTAERKRAESQLAAHREHLEQLVVERTEALRQSLERLRHAERLASVGTLATGIAHEINNPLNAILLTAHYALKCNCDDPELELALQTIAEQAQRGGRIVQSMLKFAQPERTAKVSADLNQVVRHTADLARNYVRSNRLAVTLELADSLPPITLNATAIEQVLVNLIRNAAEAADGPVAVTIRTARDTDRVRLSVGDDGPGIPPDALPYVFDPFFTTKRGTGGTGLGLSICHGIIADHGGTISVESGAGSGTTFSIHLPVSLTLASG